MNLQRSNLLTEILPIIKLRPDSGVHNETLSPMQRCLLKTAEKDVTYFSTNRGYSSCFVRLLLSRGEWNFMEFVKK